MALAAAAGEQELHYTASRQQHLWALLGMKMGEDMICEPAQAIPEEHVQPLPDFAPTRQKSRVGECTMAKALYISSLLCYVSQVCLCSSRCCPNRNRRGSPNRWSKASSLMPVCCRTQAISDVRVISKLPGSSVQMTRLTFAFRNRCKGWSFASGTPPVRRFEGGQHSMTVPHLAS